MRTLILSAVVASSIALPAFADQCQVLTRGQVTYAASILNKDGIQNRLVASFCEPCGDVFPSYYNIQKLEVIPFSGIPGRFMMLANGRAIDLAYTYARTGPNRFASVAHLVGCPTTGTRTFFDVRNGIEE